MDARIIRKGWLSSCTSRLTFKTHSRQIRREVKGAEAVDIDTVRRRGKNDASSIRTSNGTQRMPSIYQMTGYHLRSETTVVGYSSLLLNLHSEPSKEAIHSVTVSLPSPTSRSSHTVCKFQGYLHKRYSTVKDSDKVGKREL